jgi:hypothetical protein
MREIKMPVRKVFRLPPLLLLSVVAAGCGPLVTKVADSSRFNKGNDIGPPSLANDDFLNDAASRFGLMALFAEVVYRRDLDIGVRDQDGCAYAAGNGRALPSFGMPDQNSQANSSEPRKRWKRWLANSGNSPPGCVNQSGLYYETYVLEDVDGKLLEAVIAFRGTENRPSQFFSDWTTNLTAAFAFEPKQYRLARDRVPTLITALKERNPEIKIYATGHSLGGGLAQQAGYLSKHVLEVFTFNTSPVTNWSHLRLKGEVGNAYPTFHRIYHGGEILEKVRFVATSLTKARFGRHDIGLQLKSRSNFGGHSMQIIACTFAEIIANRGIDDAEHFYPVDYIKTQVIPKTSEENVCSENSE